MNHRKLAASFAASLLASSAMAASLPDASQARIATDYSAWRAAGTMPRPW